ncbi:MAG: M20/M25/M40 family metallo-hydrolase [Bacteroidetes bacterium]|nr:M20/M25/M40 family metallo-hydrolase [Bacteroidota bacterium]
MRRFVLCTLVFLLTASILRSQTETHSVPPPSVNDFTGIQSFLSSDWMEGREADTRGGFMAADFIASLMQLNGLLPYGDTGNIKEHRTNQPFNRSYFQDFELIRYRVEKSSLALIKASPEGESVLQFVPGVDFETSPVPFSLKEEASLVFAGYGIEAPGKGYDDYRGIDVRDRIVLIAAGFPGHSDTTSAAWKKLGKSFGREFSKLSVKLRVAEKHGAKAVILIGPEGGTEPFLPAIHNRDLINSAMNSAKPEPDYEDAEYYLPGDTGMVYIPCFSLSTGVARLLLMGTAIDLPGFERKAAGDLLSSSMAVSGKKLRLSVEVARDAVGVRNVLGIIPGHDTGKNILIGSHFDHLGVRKGVIYNGADDNASGVSGMLALAKNWAGHPEKPSCNIIFAAWTAEEKGLLGSDWFVRHSGILSGSLSVVINMDMISRSAPEDTLGRQLSIGTLPMNEDLKTLAKKINSHLKHPFVLDLWDVTGHTGSDYAHFAERKIPVMTFFSGFHDDYHTPRDIWSKTDPVKMEEILKIVNECILETSENPPARK